MTIFAMGLDITDFAKFSGLPGLNPAVMVLDIISGTTGKTGLVDLSIVLEPNPQCTGVELAPFPVPSSGLAYLVSSRAALHFWPWVRRRRQRDRGLTRSDRSRFPL